MQKYKEINGNDYVKNSRTTINETMQSIQSMNSGTAFPTNNLFEGMKCYRTDLKKTYTLTDVENNTWVEDAHATLSDEATHAASATKLQTARSLNLGGAVTADAATFDGTANATINVKTLDATKLKGTASVSTTGNAATATKLATARTIALSGNATGSADFDGSGNATINVTVNESAHAAKATQDTNGRAFTDTNAYMHISYLANGTDFNNVKTTGIYYCTQDTFPNRPHNSRGILTVYSIGTVKQEYKPDNAAVYYTREYNNSNWTAWSKVAASTADTCTGNAATASKLATPRTLSLTGKAAGSATFDGSANASINVTSVNADTASKLSTARKINITGNATGAATFDGTSDVSINVSVSQAAHADNATNADSATTATNVSGKIYYSADSPSVATDKLFAVKQAHAGDDNVPNNGLVIQTGPTGANYNGKLYITDNGGDGVWIGGVAAGKEVGWTRLVENKGNWSINAATATKLQTPRTISLSGNASGSANFDGSGNVSINTTVSQAAKAGRVNIQGRRANLASGQSPNAGLEIFQVYMDAGYPQQYGNVVSIGGRGHNELFLGWEYEARPYYRNKVDTSNDWTNWKPLAFISDINSFAPTKTGGGASGTWGINISGNAASATNADKVDGYHASDIINKISAANTGGIVAASLTENGYVKFANGLILQWGSHTGGGSWYHHTFPIAFSTVFDVIDGYSSTSTSQFYGYSKNITNTGFDMCIDSSETGRYIAIGI